MSDDSDGDSVIFQTLAASSNGIEHWNHVQSLNVLKVVRVIFELLLSPGKRVLWEVEELEEQKPVLGRALFGRSDQQIVRRCNG